jgi:predicted NBD/HSP70 family sugar kinase
MRRIDPQRFRVATRGTSRHINRQIALTLISSHEPISRADLARRMTLRRGAIGLLIQELLNEGHIVEGTTGQTPRGRKPTLLYLNTRQRSSVAVDVRASGTFLMLADAIGRPRSSVITMPTPREPRRLVAALGRRIRSLLAEHPDSEKCAGVGLVVPGMVDHATRRVLHAPTLGWRNVDIRDPLEAATGLPVQVENSGRACALAQVWEARNVAAPVRDLVFVSVSDGVGVGIVVNGELVRGRHNIAGEFAHMPLRLDGPRCSCGAAGCWEAHISNPATLARYFGRPSLAGDAGDGRRSFTIDDLIARVRDGDRKASAALQATARYLGLGLGAIVNILNPDCIVIGGEITAAWEAIEDAVRAAIGERALTPAAALADLVVVRAEDHPRLRGAAMLVSAPAFAAPVVA